MRPERRPRCYTVARVSRITLVFFMARERLSSWLQVALQGDKSRGLGQSPGALSGPTADPSMRGPSDSDSSGSPVGAHTEQNRVCRRVGPRREATRAPTKALSSITLRENDISLRDPHLIRIGHGQIPQEAYRMSQSTRGALTSLHAAGGGCVGN